MNLQERDLAHLEKQFTRENFNRIIEGWTKNPLIIEAFARVDRGEFVPKNCKDSPYRDNIIPLGKNSSISQPSLTAEMLDNLGLHKTDKVLEIGTGSGYTAALLSYCAERVYTIEHNPELANQARERLLQLGYHNIEVYCGDGVLGLPEKAPFDAILVTGAAREVPKALAEQLAGGGRIVLPVGKDPWNLELIKAIKFHGEVRRVANLGKAYFVPLLSSACGGFTEEQLAEIRNIKGKYVASLAQEKGIPFDEIIDLLEASAGFVDRGNVLDHVPVPEEMLDI